MRDLLPNENKLETKLLAAHFYCALPNISLAKATVLSSSENSVCAFYYSIDVTSMKSLLKKIVSLSNALKLQEQLEKFFPY